jgi:hypothetical protein
VRVAAPPRAAFVAEVHCAAHAVQGSCMRMHAQVRRGRAAQPRRALRAHGRGAVPRRALIDVALGRTGAPML